MGQVQYFFIPVIFYSYNYLSSYCHIIIEIFKYILDPQIKRKNKCGYRKITVEGSQDTGTGGRRVKSSSMDRTLLNDSERASFRQQLSALNIVLAHSLSSSIHTVSWQLPPRSLVEYSSLGLVTSITYSLGKVFVWDSNGTKFEEYGQVQAISGDVESGHWSQLNNVWYQGTGIKSNPILNLLYSKKM